VIPLRIGILGAARIADDGIVAPARVLGHEGVAVAARDRARAEAFAAPRGITRVHDGYAGRRSTPRCAPNSRTRAARPPAAAGTWTPRSGS